MSNRTRKTTAVLAALLLTVVFTASVTAGDRWLHVRVEERGDDAERVSVNIPLAMIEAILPMIESEGLSHGRVHIDRGELEGIDLREVFKALRDSPDTNFVTVQSRDETIRVAKERGFLIVNVDEGENGDRVRVRMPMDVFEALVSGRGDELDLVAALHALSEYDGGDLVTVESDDETIRVWIDGSDSGQ